MSRPCGSQADIRKAPGKARKRRCRRNKRAGDDRSAAGIAGYAKVDPIRREEPR